ncbi:MAG TPA: peptidylprolyl isomerase [Candidatus Acidoferrales bacterium]|nr:peptidylprolyl isomerase [Candidatus Acidoferrales bacterium]
MSLKHSFYFLLLSIVAAGCAASSNIDDKVIAVVGSKKITYGEFKQQYSKNYLGGSDSIASTESKEKFLDLLVDYHLKLLDAEEERIQVDPEVKAELKGYRDQLAVSYVMEREITLPMVQKIYDRQKYEARAEQVFIPFAGDTAKAHNQALEVIKELKAGTPIDSMMKKYRGGDTYYVTAGTFLQYVGGREFEDMLFTLNPGDVGPVPVQTAYGYIIVKLLERRPRVESVRASHILIPISGSTPADTLKAFNEAVAIMDSVKQGVDFGKLASDNSSDKYSAAKGGDLGFFSRGMMVRQFDQAAFSMKVGEVAGPVRTRFGYHIIKLTDIKPLPQFAEVKDKIREAYLNGGYKLDFSAFIDQLKAKYNYKPDGETLKFLYSKIDSAKQFDGNNFDSLLTPAERQKALFTFDNSAGTIDTVLSLVKSGNIQAPQTLLNWQNLSSLVDESAKQMIITYYADLKAETYPDFDSLIAQYENGILIYQVEQKNVWGKVASTDSVLKPYYFDHINKYYWPNRIDLSEIQVLTDSLANFIYDSLKAGGDFDSLAVKYTKRQGMVEKDGHWGLVADSTNALSMAAMKMKEGEFGKPINFENGYSIIRVNKFVPSGPKTFEEARPEVSADYQEAESKEVQKEWIESLRKRFGVQIDDKTFRELLAGK